MNRKYIYPITIIIVTIALYYGDKYIEEKNEDYPIVKTAVNEFSEEFDNSFLPQSTTGVVVNHVYYSLSYSEAHEQAEWVAYPLDKNHLIKNKYERPYFVRDRDVKTKSADWRNYKKSGYDRGHLCPAGDRTFNYGAFHETFLTSNISPQNPEFNRGIWNRLEQKTRYWAKKYDGVYVVTGGVLKKELNTIGDERVSVPERFYKIIIDISDGKHKAIAFLIPNKPSKRSFYEYAVSIDEIEKATGIDFFPKLPNAIEDKLEAKINLKAWGKR